MYHAIKDSTRVTVQNAFRPISAASSADGPETPLENTFEKKHKPAVIRFSFDDLRVLREITQPNWATFAKPQSASPIHDSRFTPSHTCLKWQQVIDTSSLASMFGIKISLQKKCVLWKVNRGPR